VTGSQLGPEFRPVRGGPNGGNLFIRVTVDPPGIAPQVLCADDDPGVASTIGQRMTSHLDPPAAPTRFKPGTRILVVDDEVLVRGVIKAMLERRGCDVLTASNGREGVDLFRQEAGQLDAVLIDLNMPILDGERAVEEIRQTDPNIPVWIMTGFDPAGREERLARGHVRGVLRKPLTADTLVQALTAVLGTDRPAKD
jgi:CheY-like chemotaxis protein